MIIKSKTLVFFGNERLSSGFITSAPIFRSLMDANYTIKAVVINQAIKEQQDLEVAKLASEKNIPIFSPEKPLDILQTLRDLKAEIGVLVAYGKIVPQEIIDLFPHGIVNIHPSLLPLYRGSTPIEQAILDGAKTTGISIMKLVREMDAGPIYAQKEVRLIGQENKQIITEQLLDEGAKLLLKTLPGILSDKLQPRPQDETRASYCSMISKSSGLIDWGKPAFRIEREIRAFASWPNSYCSLGTVDLIITKADLSAEKLQPGEILVTANNELHVGCFSGSLRIKELKPNGKKLMSASSFINGYRNQIL